MEPKLSALLAISIFLHFPEFHTNPTTNIRLAIDEANRTISPYDTIDLELATQRTRPTNDTADDLPSTDQISIATFPVLNNPATNNEKESTIVTPYLEETSKSVGITKCLCKRFPPPPPFYPEDTTASPTSNDHPDDSGTTQEKLESSEVYASGESIGSGGHETMAFQTAMDHSEQTGVEISRLVTTALKYVNTEKDNTTLLSKTTMINGETEEEIVTHQLRSIESESSVDYEVNGVTEVQIIFPDPNPPNECWCEEVTISDETSGSTAGTTEVGASTMAPETTDASDTSFKLQTTESETSEMIPDSTFSFKLQTTESEASEMIPGSTFEAHATTESESTLATAALTTTESDPGTTITLPVKSTTIPITTTTLPSRMMTTTTATTPLSSYQLTTTTKSRLELTITETTTEVKESDSVTSIIDKISSSPLNNVALPGKDEPTSRQAIASSGTVTRDVFTSPASTKQLANVVPSVSYEELKNNSIPCKYKHLHSVYVWIVLMIQMIQQAI